MLFRSALSTRRLRQGLLVAAALDENIENQAVLAVHDLTEENLHAILRVSPNLRFISQSAYLGLFRYEIEVP